MGGEMEVGKAFKRIWKNNKNIKEKMIECQIDRSKIKTILILKVSPALD